MYVYTELIDDKTEVNAQEFGASNKICEYSLKYFYHKQIRKSEIIFLFFLAKDVVDNLLNSIHSYVGKNYAYTVIDLCRWFNAVRIGSNDAIKFLLATSRLDMMCELLVTRVIVIMSFPITHEESII